MKKAIGFAVWMLMTSQAMASPDEHDMSQMDQQMQPSMEDGVPYEPIRMEKHQQPVGVHPGDVTQKERSVSTLPGTQIGEPKAISNDMQGMQDMKMDMSGMQGDEAPPDARNPDDYADGLDMGPMPGMDMADDALYGNILLEKFEYFHSNNTNGIRLDGMAWYGGDRNKLWIKADGGRADGRNSSTRTEALWDRTFSPYWSTQIGVRHDAWEGPGRNWAAFGVQGLAPYWFDVEATAYIGESGRTAFRTEATYDFLLTQRLILQPTGELNIYGKDDSDRSIGSGLSDVELGLRLRYEIKREIAPYVGISWKRKYGQTADFARDDGQEVNDTQLLVGVRLWY